MDAAEFKKLISKHFSPKIRELGWKGSGFNFRKHEENHIVKIFGLHGSWYGGSVCCETAIHFDFIPDLAHKEIDINKMTFASCVIRKRLSPKGEGDYHWAFKNKEEDNINSINQIWEAFQTHGANFYKDFENFPSPFDIITVQDLQVNRHYRILNKYSVPNQIHLAWILKEINAFLGKVEIAKEFAEHGFKRACEHAESMAKDFGKLDSEYLEKNRQLFKIE